MRFALRCIIYLGAVYVAILRHDGYLVDPRRLADTALAIPQQAAKQIAPQIATRVEAYCLHDTAACVADAVALAQPLTGSGTSQAAQHRRVCSTAPCPRWDANR